MNMKKCIAFMLVVCVLFGLSGCGGNGSAVYVQSVAELSGRGGIAPGDRFSCMVVSEHVAEIERDNEKSVKELLVREGDDVKQGQELFSYDTDELKLTLEKQTLEKEQLETQIENLKNDIAELEKDRERAGTRDKLQYTVQIQTSQVDLKEAELNLKTKKAEVKKSKEILKNATVKSPVEGRVQSISESGTDNNGETLPYITIQQAGAYRIKGTIGEQQRGGIMEGDRVKMISRADESQVWMGTVSLVDYENPVKGNSNMYMGGMAADEMNTSSKYPFYVELDSNDGLIMGQHLYLELDNGEGIAAGLNLSMAFICFEDNGNAYVWADNGRNKLEKRTVTLGQPDDMMGTYSILSGLSDSDYIAFPDEEVCHAGAPTTKVMPVEESNGADGNVGAADMGAMGPMDMGAMDAGAVGAVVDSMDADTAAEFEEIADEVFEEGEVD